MKTKTIAMIMAMTMILVGLISGTLAWLTDSTTEVKNTFTTSGIEVELTENKSDFKMIPGHTIDKDPKVTVKANSEECWLFVKVEKSTNFDSYLTYEMAEGWVLVTGATNVYARKVESAQIGTAFSVLAGDKVTVQGTVTTAMMEEIDGELKEGQTKPTKEEELAARPTLTFTAYASQLWKTNKPGTGATEAEIAAAQFDAVAAWNNVPKS